MRVLHILEATSGGTRRHVLDLLSALQGRGVRCSLVYSAERNPDFRSDIKTLQSDGIETYEIAMGHRWARTDDGKALQALHAHLKTHRYDVIHCHSSNAGLLGRIANAFQTRKTPLVYTPHFIAFATGLPRWQRRAALYSEKLLTAQTTHYIAVSQHEHSLLRRVLGVGKERMSLIYNGLDANAWPSPKPQHVSRDSPFVIGCFGRLTAQKNQFVLIRMLPQIIPAIPHVRLKLFGSGEEESALRALAKQLHCDEHVDFEGEVCNPREEYFHCDLIAQPSRWEGCSYALLEAMAASRAIIASTVGGNREVLGNAGVLLSLHVIAAWTHAIIALANDAPYRVALGQAAQTRVTAKFRHSLMIEKTIGVYERVMAESKD
jgi:glycosyltransferase involved in cell wall biosynthesis